MTKIAILGVLILITVNSCKRDYLCACTFEGKAVPNKEIYNTSKSDAQNQCDLRETSIPGQKWDCTAY